MKKIMDKNGIEIGEINDDMINGDEKLKEITENVFKEYGFKII